MRARRQRHPRRRAGRRRGGLRRARGRRDARATSPPRASPPATTSSSASCSARSTSSAAPRCPARASTTSRRRRAARARRLALAPSSVALARASPRYRSPDARHGPRSWPAPGSSAPTPPRSTASRPTTCTSSARRRCALAGYHADEIVDLSGAAAVAGCSTCYRREAGSTARTPAASSASTSSTRSRCSSTADPRTPRPSTSGCWRWEERMLDGARGALPRHRRRRRRPRRLGGPQVRLRGVGAHPGALPRDDLDVELHDLPGAPARHPRARPRRPGARSSRRSTAPWRRRGGWSRSWRTTSSPTAASPSRAPAAVPRRRPAHTG